MDSVTDITGKFCDCINLYNKMKNLTWTYRVVRRKIDKDYTYGIHEVYGGKKKISITVEPCWPLGDSWGELYSDMEAFVKALKLPVLDYETLSELKG